MPLTDESRAEERLDRRVIQELIDEQWPFDCNIIQVDARTWAIHGTIPVGGESILAEFTTRQEAIVALQLLAAAEQQSDALG